MNNKTQKNWLYASNGRAALYHILKSIDINKILIPIYICHTILEPIKRLKIKPIFYDINLDDLNANFESIKFLIDKYNIKTILIASMYGNIANLNEIEIFCKNRDIFMIDDAAQSFGTKLDNRYVGTFGSAGFFSFSPGKPTAAHMGAFFWSSSSINIKRDKAFFTHYFRWLDFYINRYNIYTKYNYFLKKFINILSRFLLKFFDVYNNDISNFEKRILGGVLFDNINGKFQFRNSYYKQFVKKFVDYKFFDVIENKRGICNNHKLIMIFYDISLCHRFIEYMKMKNIYVSNGYELLSNYDVDHCKNALLINKKVVELPIENDNKKMKYIFNRIEDFANSNKI